MFASTKTPSKTTSSLHNNAPASNEVCLIGPDTVITGSFRAPANIRLEGTINGDVTSSGRLVLAANAKIMGQVSCADLISEGKIEGDIVANGKVHLHSTAVILGDVKYQSIQIDGGAQIDGQLFCAKLPVSKDK